MVSKFCENLGHRHLNISRNSHLSNQIFIIENMSNHEFVSRANKLNQNFFLVPGIWCEAKKESNEMIKLVDESFISNKLDSIRFARIPSLTDRLSIESFRFENYPTKLKKLEN